MTRTLSDAELEVEVFEKLLAAIHHVLGIEKTELTIDTTFQSLGASSLDVVALVFELEDAFDVEILDRNLARFQSLRQARDTVVSLVKAAA